MKTQKKTSRVDALEKRMAATTNVLQQLINEISYLKTLSMGTLETVKLLDGYEKAIEILKEKNSKEISKKEETDTSRKIIE
jgi:hypothetical protein